MHKYNKTTDNNWQSLLVVNSVKLHLTSLKSQKLVMLWLGYYHLKTLNLKDSLNTRWKKSTLLLSVTWTFFNTSQTKSSALIESVCIFKSWQKAPHTRGNQIWHLKHKIDLHIKDSNNRKVEKKNIFRLPNFCVQQWVEIMFSKCLVVFYPFFTLHRIFIINPSLTSSSWFCFASWWK